MKSAYFVLTLGVLAASISQHVIAEERKLKALTLFPASTLQIETKTDCSLVTNLTSRSLVVLPLDGETWASFARNHYSFVSIKPCRAQ